MHLDNSEFESMESGILASTAKELIKLNLGCGLQAPPGWINIDASWNARLAKQPLLRRLLHGLHLLPPDKASIPWSPSIFVHDVRKPLPFATESVAAIYASHILEHLYVEEARRLMADCFRVLAPGCALRVVVPDVRAIVLEYINDRPMGVWPADFAALRPADRLNQRLLMRWPSPPKRHLFYRLYNSSQDFHSHKWMYDADSLISLFQAVGFSAVEPRDVHQSSISEIEKVEDPSRILSGAGVCVEGIKP